MFGYSRVSASCCRLTVRWPRWSLRSGSRRLLPTVDTASGSILALRPVTFHYKSDTKGIPQFGLIAEKVATVNRVLVLPNKQGETLHHALRRGERDVAQRVSQSKPQNAGIRIDSRKTATKCGESKKRRLPC